MIDCCCLTSTLAVFQLLLEKNFMNQFSHLQDHKLCFSTSIVSPHIQQYQRFGANLWDLNILCASQSRTWISNVNVVVFFSVQLRWQVIVRFVDIGEIDDHLCLNFLFIIKAILFSKSFNENSQQTSHSLWCTMYY